MTNRFLVLVLLLAQCSVAFAQEEPIVIVLSWDGTRHDYPERVATPALSRMQREGARAKRLVPVFPTNTFPNHVSLATGAPVDVHGVVGNRFLDTERGAFRYSNDASWIEAEPLWVAAERQGVRAAVFFWVGSETNWNGIGATHRKTPFDAKIPESEKVDQIEAWLDLPPGQRPGLIMSWWNGCDHVGHANGPRDAAIARQLAAHDAQLARLLAAIDARELWSQTTLIVLSDHGMTRATHSVEVENKLSEAGIEASFVAGGGVGYVHLEQPDQVDAARETLDALEGVESYASEALPKELRAGFAGRQGQIIVIATPPHSFSRISQLRGWRRWFRWLAPEVAGMHGYRAEHPDMSAVFYAMGRGVGRGSTLGSVRTLDVAATVAGLLGIEPPRHSEGSPIPLVSSHR